MKLLTMLSLVAVAVPLIRAEELGVTFYEAPAPIKGVVWDVPVIVWGIVPIRDKDKGMV